MWGIPLLVESRFMCDLKSRCSLLYEHVAMQVSSIILIGSPRESEPRQNVFGMHCGMDCHHSEQDGSEEDGARRM